MDCTLQFLEEVWMLKKCFLMKVLNSEFHFEFICSDTVYKKI